MILLGCHSDSMLCEKFLCVPLAQIQFVPQPRLQQASPASLSTISIHWPITCALVMFFISFAAMSEGYSSCYLFSITCR